MNKKYEAVFCAVNAGFAEDVLYAARKAGAAGGTIIKGRGTTSREAEEQFNIIIQPEKELVMMLVPHEIKDKVLRSVYEHTGLESRSQGIIFSLPVTDALGLKDFEDKSGKETQQKAEE